MGYILPPHKILADVAKRLINPLDLLGLFGFTILFTAFLTICTWMFVSLRHLDQLCGNYST